MNRETLIIIGLSIAFLCGWSTPRSRYQLFRYETDNPKLFLNAIRMDTWTGEIQTIFNMPDPSGVGSVCEYWGTVPVKKTQEEATQIYNDRKAHNEKYPKK